MSRIVVEVVRPSLACSGVLAFVVSCSIDVGAPPLSSPEGGDAGGPATSLCGGEFACDDAGLGADASIGPSAGPHEQPDPTPEGEGECGLQGALIFPAICVERPYCHFELWAWSRQVTYEWQPEGNDEVEIGLRLGACCQGAVTDWPISLMAARTCSDAGCPYWDTTEVDRITIEASGSSAGSIPERSVEDVVAPGVCGNSAPISRAAPDGSPVNLDACDLDAGDLYLTGTFEGGWPGGDLVCRVHIQVEQ